ncbi:MAG TPA: FAD-binding oxidoreductase [Tepidisphaeraceae bacterium]|nr:FAD-binding oxidoreductase [Tepidisphaeraceae bacterium]
MAHTRREIVNDVHSRLNATRVAGIARPRDADELRAALKGAAELGLAVSVCGGRHAMGGQQFGDDTLLIDTTSLTRTLGFDSAAGHVDVEAGAQWPEVIRATHAVQGDDVRWGIRQKQTGADAMTLGGAIAANVHGRGLRMRPFVDDIESLEVCTAGGEIVACSRERNAELFSLVVGGYGLFGVVARVRLRLGPRQKLRRLVDILDIDDAVPAVQRRVAEGCLYGDFQYAIDPADDSFLRRGVGASYKRVAPETPISDESSDLKERDWIALLRLAHTNKGRAFEVYSAHYLASHGRVYWSDTMQLSTYIPSYDQFLKDGRERGAKQPEESLMIGELMVPPEALVEFLNQARAILRATGVEDIYGTIRAIQPDDTTFLPWARRHYACVIFNLRTVHDAAGLARTATAFRGLTDAALALGGSFYLTYHRYASPAQVETAYPSFRRFLQLKRQYDPELRFQSDWYRHYAALFA